MAELAESTDGQNPITEHNYSKSPAGIDVLGFVGQPVVKKRQLSVTSLDKEMDTADRLFLNLLCDLTRQLKGEQGEEDTNVGDPCGISHEALNALSEGQIFSLMTSNSLNYDIVHHLMYLKRQTDFPETAKKMMMPMDTNPSSDSRHCEVPMDTSDHSVSASQRAQPSPAAPHAPIQTPDLVDLVGRFSSLDAQGKQSMVDCLVQTIVAQSGRISVPGKSTELNEILKNMILVLQQQIQSGKGVDFQQLQLQAKKLTDQKLQNMLSPPAGYPASNSNQSTGQQHSNDVVVKVEESGDKPSEEQEVMKEANEPKCLNEGCSNPPVDNVERGPLYCSNDCLVHHCRVLFNNWVREKKLRTK